MIGFAMTGSFCNFENALAVLERLRARNMDIVPVMSFNARTLDTRFGKATDFAARIETLCARKIVDSLPEAEPLGPKIHLDALLICPCTGNTLSKLACGIYDTPVTLAAKAHLRTGRPLVVALATNDALSGNFESIAKMYRRKHVYFVPLACDDPLGKPYSLVCDFSLVERTLDEALEGKQTRPLFAFGNG